MAAVSHKSRSADSARAAILERVRAEGFDAAGMTGAGAIPHVKDRLAAFLKEGWHGDMGWLETRADQRADPATLWPEVKSIVMVGLNYGPAEDPMEMLARKERGIVSVYARNADYHDTIKKRLKRIGRWLCDEFGCEVKVFVDTAPVAEKPLAEAAGLGWQGKHTNLVSREKGSWLFLGAIFTTLDLPTDEPEEDHCGSCRRCLDICPTDAFPDPYRLDARRCISYLTIEHKGHIPHEFRRPMGNRIYGCDDCLAVCPWNKYADRARETAFHARAELSAPRLTDLVQLDEAGFRELFAGSPIKRTGRDRFVRNCLIALGNTGNPDHAPLAEALLSDASPLVRAMAVWACGELMDTERFAALKAKHQPAEADRDVRTEWARAFTAPDSRSGL